MAGVSIQRLYENVGRHCGAKPQTQQGTERGISSVAATKLPGFVGDPKRRSALNRLSGLDPWKRPSESAPGELART
jgi:hypothetical protein